jgi:hypothetical protein
MSPTPTTSTPTGATSAPTPLPAGSDGNGVGSGNFNAVGLINSGIGAAPTTYAAPGSVVTPGVTPTLGTEGYDKLRQSLYEQSYNPAAQEIQRTGLINDRALQSTLAGAGLVSSGAGIGQEVKAQQDRAQQLGNLATNAAATATGQTLTLQQQEQQANAGRVLTGNMADAENYLKTIGLDQKSATDAKNSFLQYLGIQETDLSRMDANQQNNVGTALNAWLQQWATLAGAGKTAQSSGDSSGWQGGIQGQRG